jgi:galactose mutarotase-like enzyme
MHQITNNVLTVSITDKGAELQSIYSKETQLEYLWNADPVFWSKKSPVLFPIVGGLKNNTYFYNGKGYHLNRHGFARDMVFDVTEQYKDSIVFTLTSSSETEKLYPFQFVFSIKYQLQQNQLITTYSIKNTGNHEMYFSVGAHPAFKVPVTEGAAFNDYYLQFNKIENVGRWPLSNDGLIELSPIPLLNNSQQLELNKPLFYKDALVFKHLSSDSISILTHKDKHGVTLSYSNFP